MVALLTACSEEVEEEEASIPRMRSPKKPATPAGGSVQAPPLRFTDITERSGIDFLHENGAVGDKWMPETMGSGCALFDYDEDGDLDALLVNSQRWDGTGNARTRLYENGGTADFVDVTERVGLDVDVYGMGATVADYDADGDLDIYITALGPNVLLRNDAGRFVDVAKEAGVPRILVR